MKEVITNNSKMNRNKDKSIVNPNDVLNYLISKGLSKNQALGIVANINYESGFNPNAIGDSGSSFGLFQHHNERGQKLKAYTNNNLNDWKKQVDYALSERSTRQYLNRDYSKPEEATYWFTVLFERPSDKYTKGVQRQGWLKGFEGGKYYTGTYNPKNINTELKIAGNKGYGPTTISSGSSEFQMNAPDTYSPYSSNWVSTPDAMPTDLTTRVPMDNLEFLSSFEKEVEKQEVTDKKVEESPTRQELEALALQKKQQQLQQVVVDYNKTVGDQMINKNSNDEERIAKAQKFIDAYKIDQTDIQQGLPNMPSIWQFEEGGEMEDEEDEPEYKILNLTEKQAKELASLGYDVVLEEEDEEEGEDKEDEEENK